MNNNPSNPDKSNQLEWLFEKRLPSKGQEDDSYEPHYGDVTELNTNRLLLDSVGKDTLRQIAEDAINLLETSVAIFESNGDYAFGMFSSGWCQLMDTASRKLCNTDDNRIALDCGCWLCHENCWNDSAKASIESGQSTDIQCVGGINLYAEPIYAGKSVVGTINIGYGKPPTDLNRLKDLADIFDIDIEKLKEQADSYNPRPLFMVDLAKKRLQTSANLIGEIVEKSILQKSLVQSEESLRSIIHRSPFPIAVADLADEKISYWSQSAIDKFGHTPENVSEWYALAYPDPDYRKNVIKRWKPFQKKALESKEAVNTGEYQIVCKDGTIKTCELYAQIIPGNLIVTFNDVTERNQSEENFRRRENQYNAIVENSGDYIMRYDREHRHIWANQNAIRATGLTPEQYLGKTHREMDFPEHLCRLWEKNIDEVFTTREVRRVEFDIELENGRMTLDLQFNPEFDDEGNVLSVIGVSRDITERKKAEDSLKKNEQRYKKAQRMGKVGNWEYDLMTGKFWASDEAKNIYGFGPERKDFTIDEVENCIPDRERVHKALIDLIEKEQPYDLEFEVRPINGQDKRIIKSIAEIVKNETGMPTKVAGVIHDITARKLANEQQRKSEEKYRRLFNSIRDYILVADTDRNIIACNQALVDGFGYTEEEILEKKTVYLYDSIEEYQEIGEMLKEHIDDANFTYTINYKKKSGDIFPGEVNVYYLKNDQEEIIGFISMIRDISYRKMIEESLQNANYQLKEKTVALEDMNAALRALLNKRYQDAQEIEEKIFCNYELMIIPFFDKLKNSYSNKIQRPLIEIIETNLKDIISPFSKKLSDPMINLTPKEIQVASFIKQGITTKEIAQTLGCSVRTIDTHRDNIRVKLKIKNKKINLRSYLMNL